MARWRYDERNYSFAFVGTLWRYGAVALWDFGFAFVGTLWRGATWRRGIAPAQCSLVREGQEIIIHAGRYGAAIL